MQNLISPEDSLQVALDKMQADSKVLQLQMKQIEEAYRMENANQMKTFNKRKEETDVEIEELKVKLHTANEKDFNSRMAEKDAKTTSLEDLYAKKLAENVKLTSELNAVKKEKSALFSHTKAVIEYQKQFETHYEQKKKLLKIAEEECIKLKQTTKKSEEEKCLLEERCCHLESNLRILDEELFFYKKNADTTTIEIQQIKTNNALLMSKLSDVYAEKDSSDVLSTTPSVNSMDAKSCASERLACIFPFMF